MNLNIPDAFAFCPHDSYSHRHTPERPFSQNPRESWSPGHKAARGNPSGEAMYLASPGCPFWVHVFLLLLIIFLVTYISLPSRLLFVLMVVVKWSCFASLPRVTTLCFLLFLFTLGLGWYFCFVKLKTTVKIPSCFRGNCFMVLLLTFTNHLFLFLSSLSSWLHSRPT